MRTIAYILQKEFLQILRNRTMLPMIFMLPLVQMFILVYAASFDLKNVNIFLVDNDLSQTSRDLTSRFNASPFFNISETSFNKEDGEISLTKNNTDFVMFIPSGFEQTLLRDDKAQIQFLINAVDGSKASLIYNYVQGILSGFNKELIAKWHGLPEFNPPMKVEVRDNYWFNSELDYKWFMAPGILTILVTLIGIFLSGMNLVREKELGTIEQLNVTPIRNYQFILGKLIPFLIIALFDLAFGLVIAHLIFGLPVTGSLFLLFGYSTVYLIGILGLGLFVSTIGETQQQVMFVTFFFLVVFILMGGIFTPVENMPDWAQTLNRVNPLSYMMRGMRMIILKGSGFADLIREFTALGILGFVFISFAILRYRKTN
jgi:ABC-type multidrug transport system, permease component